MTKRCANPKPQLSREIINSGTGKGPKAVCPGCEKWVPAAQVPWGQELRNSAGEIVGTYAPVAH